MRTWTLISLTMLPVFLLAGCGAPAEPSQAALPALKVTGASVEVGWTEAELRSMGTLEVAYMNKDGETTTYSGVLISRVLDEARVLSGGETLILMASDGYTFELPLADVRACTDCVVAFDPAGGLRSVLPGESSKAQVRGLVELQIR